MTDAFVVDPARSSLILRTRARGLFAALGHDLEIHAAKVNGEASRDGAAWSGRLVVPVAGLEVVGVLRRGELRRDVLSDGDRREIARKVRDEVFRGVEEVVVTARGTPEAPVVRVSIAGNEADAQVTVEMRDEQRELHVHAAGGVSMRALGLREVKAPLGAFVVRDTVEIEASLVVVPSPAAPTGHGST